MTKNIDAVKQSNIDSHLLIFHKNHAKIVKNVFIDTYLHTAMFKKNCKFNYM